MLLRIEELSTHFHTPGAVVRAVDSVSLAIPRGKTVALVGESGCGKSVTALSILRLIRPPGRIVGGRIAFEGCNLRDLSEREMRRIRGGRIAMVFQEPMSCLNPVMPVGRQIIEAIRLHHDRRSGGRRGERAAATELLRQVGIPAPESRLREFPHRLSGGMRQRVMLAMALAGRPALLIADEPTTALDVTIQAQILALLRELQTRNRMSVLLVTHDLGVVAQAADMVCVMYAGRIVERAPVERLFDAPRHPYTQGLLRSLPRLSSAADARRLEEIPGEVPDPRARPTGCAFHPRCPLGRDVEACRTSIPLLVAVAAEHECACWKVEPATASGACPSRPT